MTSDDIDMPGTMPEPGREVVLEPTPPGLWLALLGGSVAVLAPLLGFVVGGAIGVEAAERSLDPMVLSLFAGIVLGGVGLLVALLGAKRLWQHFHRAAAAEAGKPSE